MTGALAILRPRTSSTVRHTFSNAGAGAGPVRRFVAQVGWIFTDLEVEPGLQPPNNTKYKRFVTDDNSMLTGYEVIYAAMCS